jgi:hypothetical protein
MNKLKRKKESKLKPTNTPMNNPINAILLRCGFTNPQHVHDSIAINNGEQDIDKLKSVKANNLEADCRNGNIRQYRNGTCSDDLGLKTFTGFNNGQMRSTLGSGYDDDLSDKTHGIPIQDLF